jgi:hypothetical protein
MSYGRPEHTDVMVVAEIQKPFVGELGAVVRDNAVGNPKAMDGDGTGLDPLGKFVDGDEQVGEAPGCSL